MVILVALHQPLKTDDSYTILAICCSQNKSIEWCIQPRCNSDYEIQALKQNAFEPITFTIKKSPDVKSHWLDVTYLLPSEMR